MGGTREFLAGMGAPVDGDDPAFWDEVFGFEKEPPSPRGYSKTKTPGCGPFRSWEDFLTRTSQSERIRWCAIKAKVANRQRLISGSPKTLMTAAQVWEVLSKAEGRCSYCGSLALERRPSDPRTGAPRRWHHIGRRIGSLDHVSSRAIGGANTAGNLTWACLWCNTWPQDRRRGARDHGALHPVQKSARPPRAPAPRRRSRR